MRVKTGWRSAAVVCTAAGLLSLAGCQSGARQDVYQQHTGVCSYLTPTVSGVRTYDVSGKGAPDSAIAYPDPATPVFCDRPLNDTLLTNLELADYRVLLQSVGWFTLLQRSGPWTVFAVPNNAIEAYDASIGNMLRDPGNLPFVRTLTGYTIVHGRWPMKRLEAAVAASHTHAIQLKTLSGLPLVFSRDPASGQLQAGNGAGGISHFWVRGVPQSNGVLYFMDSLLQPPALQKTPVSGHR
ncbi:fasciclin domain-containing protein [Acetobacter sp. AN02]|uniref:fasciclin domain-containing protein n=1 Tax=Acetobacter sp. AN02 TaxID=2894186 RepID=UPI0024343541|nr:fasciclin domain-containing protein [Acetobacter sp. AN02]MDG6094761.1 fasciclin domain-containing protein [Acetobacter sp. AN02]